MRVSVEGNLPGLKALMERMKQANRSVLVGVPAGAMEEGAHARSEKAAGKLQKRALRQAVRNLRNGREVSESLAETIATGGVGGVIPLAVIAATHEFGSPEHGIPERSFLRAGIRRGIPKFNALNYANLRKVLLGQKTIEETVEMLGVVAAGEVRREFTSGEFAPLKLATIKRKGSSRPLIDTGQLRQSITYVVEGSQSANAKVIG